MITLTKNPVSVWAILFFSTIKLFGQNVTTIPPSSPSASSFATYVSIPPVNASGIPEITYPLMTLPTKSKDVVFNFGLQYHPNNISLDHNATNVGLGWSLFGAGVVTRNIIYEADEYNNGDPSGRSYDDEYFYNFLGHSGRFYFKREVQNNQLASNFKAVHSGQSLKKIEFTNTATLGVYITSFSITDERGIKYVFNKNDLAISYIHTAYHLTQIIDQAGNLIATLDYELLDSMSNFMGVTNNYSLKRINAIGVGSIDFVATSNVALRRTRNDIVQFNSMQMKNFRGEIIRTCKLEYDMISHMPASYAENFTGTARFLKKLAFYDSGNIPIETYQFSYIHHSHPPFNLSNSESFFDDYGFTKYGDGSTPENGRNGVLEKVSLPTGGQIVYDFGGNKIDALYYDSQFYFSGPQNDDFFNENSDFPGQMESNTVWNNTEGGFIHSPTTQIGSLGAGYHTGYGAGLRINRIRYYDAAGTSISSKTVTYDYRDFNLPQYDSGEMIRESITGRPAERITYGTKVYYKNIKVTVGTGNGYTKYCYYSPYDTMKNHWGYASPFGGGSIRFVWPSFSFLNESPIKYSEIYSEDNILLQRDKYYYASQLIEGRRENNFYLRWSDSSPFGEYLNSICHRYRVTEKFSYSPFSVMTERSFTRFNKKNFQIESESKFSSKLVQNPQPGANAKEIQSMAKYLYPDDLPNDPMATELIAKNILSVPMITEYFTNDNVKLSTQKTVFKNWGNGWITPETVESSKGTDLPETGAKVLRIDPNTGNPLEVEDENGMITSYIWGYNGTLLVAKIENLSYDMIPPPHTPSQSVESLTSSSGANLNFEQLEVQILNSLSRIRKHSNLRNSMMTSYTYKPLVGVTSVTDPQGITTSYRYDTYGRLATARDQNGNLISETAYRLKTQN